MRRKEKKERVGSVVRLLMASSMLVLYCSPSGLGLEGIEYSCVSTRTHKEPPIPAGSVWVAYGGQVTGVSTQLMLFSKVGYIYIHVIMREKMAGTNTSLPKQVTT